MRQLTYTIDESFEGKKISALLVSKGFSSEIIKMLKRGGLYVNGGAAPTVFVLSKNDTVKIIFPDEENTAQPILASGVKIVYADEDLVIADKPPFLPMHQSIAHYEDTLANHFAAIYPKCRFRCVTRLDKNTSGLCVIALNKPAAAILCHRRPQKLYYAVVEGITEKTGTVNAPIAREEESMIKRKVCAQGQPAITHYKTLKTNADDNVSLLEISPETGRTHQIRVHMSYIGHPLCGDELYAGRTDIINRQALHCGYVKFFHPLTGKEMEFKSQIPEDMKKLLYAKQTSVGTTGTYTEDHEKLPFNSDNKV